MVNGVDKSKIEERAIGVLKNIINEHPTMESGINHGDKYMSWDGSIIIYKPGSKIRTKETYDYDIPVQIKGRTDGVVKYLNKTTITYGVDIRDLKLYYEQRGCLYFIVFFDETAKRGEVFYASLFPSKLKSYLENDSNKGKKKLSIDFTHLNKDANELYCVLAQYGKEMVRQGYGRGPIVAKTIRLNEIAKVESISATVVGAKNELDFIKRMNSGDVCIYGQVNGMDFPIESDKSVKFFMGRDNIQLPIMIEEKEYYSKYNVVINPNGDLVVKPSENIVLDISNGKIDFRPQSNISKIKNDIEFLLALENTSEFHIGAHVIPFGNIRITKSDRGNFSLLKDICDAVTEIGIDIHKPFSQLSESNFRELQILVSIKKGLFNDKFNQPSSIYNWSFDNRYYPILIENQPKGIIIFPLTKNSTMQIFKGDGKISRYIFPTFAVLEVDVLANLYSLDCSWFEHQIDIADVNSDTTGDLNFASLKLVSAYDLSHNKEFLNLAKRLYSRFNTDELYCLINVLQIKARETGLSDSDIEKLRSIETNDLSALFCISVLLAETENAEKYFIKMSKDEKDSIKELPIMKLYTDMKKL